MTELQELVTKFIRVYLADGSPVTGLTISNFTVVAMTKTKAGTLAAWSHGSTMTDVGAALGSAWNGIYAWSYTKASVACDDGIDLETNSSAHFWRFVTVGGELESRDLVSAFNAANNPRVAVSGSGTIGQVTPLTLIAHRYRQITFTFVDDDGNNIDMTVGTTYTNYAFSTRDPIDQTATPQKYDQTTGITAGDGFVTVTILESATFHDSITEGASAADTKVLKYELTADLVAVAGETVSLVQSSNLTLSRREVGT